MRKTPKRNAGRRGERGNTIIEFALCMTFLMPLLLGTFSVGMNLSRNLQVTQLARNAGHMYVRWVDFSQTGSQDMMVRLAEGLNMTRTGGDGTMILTQVLIPTASDCTANNLSTAQCVNLDTPVIIHRVAFGNTALKSSSHGTPPAGMVESNGTIAPADYLTQTNLRASNFSSALTLASGELAYISEVYFRSRQFDLAGAYNDTGVYARAIF